MNANGYVYFSGISNLRIAPYHADVDIRGIGDIYYRQTSDPRLLARATCEIKAAFPSLSKSITNLFIATWDAVGYYSYGTDKVRFKVSITIINFVFIMQLTCWQSIIGLVVC